MRQHDIVSSGADWQHRPAERAPFLVVFLKGKPSVVGVMLNIIGILQIILGTLLLIDGHGFYIIIVFPGALFFLVAANITIIAMVKGTFCLVVVSLVMNLFCVLPAFIQISSFSPSITDCTRGHYWNEGMLCTMMVVLAILALTGLVLSVYMSVIGWKSVYWESAIGTEPGLTHLDYD